MKLQNIITQMENEFNEKWTGRRFDDIGEVHDDFKAISSKIFPRAWEVYSWSVRLKKQYLELMKYELDITDDKRYKWKRAGRVNKMTLKTLLPITDETTVEEYLIALNKREAEEAVERTEMTLESLRKDMEKFEKELEERKQHLATFN